MLKIRREVLTADQTVFEFASPDGRNRVALILAAPNGQPKLAVRRNGVETLLAAPYQLPEGKWTKVGVSLGEAGTVVMLNDRIAAEAPRLTVEPWNLGLRAGILGRGVGGGWFKGTLAEVTFSSVPLVDRRPPAPDPAQWCQPPTMLNRRTLFMRAVPGEKAIGGIEYRFSDPQSRFDSNWQPSPEFIAKNLWPGHEYKITVAMRDAAGIAGKPSEPALVTLLTTELPAYSLNDGLVVFEAERFQTSAKAGRGEWVEVADLKYSGGKGMEVPDCGATANTQSVVAGESPRLDYRIDFPKAGKYFVSVRCWAIHGGNNSFHLGCDYTSKPKRIEFPPEQLAWCEPVEIEVTEPGVHLLQVWMDRDGAVLDQVGVSSSKQALGKL